MNEEFEIQGLIKHFGAELIIDGVSFQVRDNEFFVLLGPSGGGKTTLLRMICGLERPDKGRIMLKKSDITELAPRYRNVGMFFQDYGLYPNMDVYGNIAYGLQVRGVKRPEVERRVRTAAEMLEITPLIRRPVTNLSGGEQQRVALARVLVKDADIYLYDEPLSNLDPKLRLQARKDILKVHRAKQKPSIYVTHDLMEAFTLGDRIAVIANKRLQQVGTPDELMNTPRNLFVARFAGTPPMNLLRCEIEWSEGSYMAQSQGISFRLPAKWTRHLKRYDYTELIVGIRPAQIIPEWLFPQMEAEPLAVLPAEVVSVEPLFAEVIMTLKVGDGVKLTSVFQETDRRWPRPGGRIKIGIYGEHLSLFDPTTEQALKLWYD